MRYLYLLFAVMILFPFNAFAQTSFETVCTRLTEHQPDNDVAYRAGVDVNGNPVVPADLNAGFQPNTSFEIPVTVDLAERLDIDIKGLELEPSFGTLVYTGEDNRVLYGGQDITSRALYLCNDNNEGETYTTETVTDPVNEITVDGDTNVVIESQPVVVPGTANPYENYDENYSQEIIEGDYGQDTINGIYND